MPVARRAPNEGTITKRKDGRWHARVHLGYRDGKRLRKSLYGRSRREVQQKLTKALHDIDRGVQLATNERLPVGDFLDRWLADDVRHRVRPLTLRSYTAIVNQHLKPAFGSTPLRKLEPRQVQSLLGRKLEAGLSSRRVQYIHAVLRASLNKAERWGLVTRNVAKLVDPPRVNRPELRPLGPAELQRLFVAVRDHRWEALYVLAAATGMRQGELLGLQWAHVDLQGRTLQVRTALQRIDGELRLVEPKTARSRRRIALPQIAVEALQRHRRRQAEERLLAGTDWAASDFVFTTSRGTPIDAASVTRALKRLLKDAGLRDQRFHDLRHACASLMVAQGVHPRVVMEALGHSQISLTMNTYSHVLPEAQKQAADLLDSVLAANA
jgi:integrase